MADKSHEGSKHYIVMEKWTLEAPTENSLKRFPPCMWMLPLRGFTYFKYGGNSPRKYLCVCNKV